MDFKQAGDFVLLFGKYRGQTVDQIAQDDQGLLYLDWLRGEREGQSDKIDRALDTFLSDPAIEHDLTELVSSTT